MNHLMVSAVMAIANTEQILQTQKIVVRSLKMGLLKSVKSFQSSFNELWESMDNLYKTIILLPNSDDRDRPLKDFGRLEQSREWYWNSMEELIEVIDEHVRIE